MIDSIKIIVRILLNNSYFLGLLSFLLVFVPIIGIWAIHKYNWQHWEPFDKYPKN
jgi:hypothetical protein